MLTRIIKRDGREVAFDRSKILNGIIKACEKRPVSMAQMEETVNDIEKTISNSMQKEIESYDIGEMVMNRLKEIDEVAYVRFASVYRQFTDINTFISEIENLLGSKKK